MSVAQVEALAEATKSVGSSPIRHPFDIEIMHDKVKGEQADLKCGNASGYHRFIKKQKLRIERRRAKQNPECAPAYSRYAGWES